MTDSSDVRAAVRERYARAALRVLQPQTTDSNTGCCGGQSSCGCGCTDADAADSITGNLYRLEDVADLPADALAASLGCGNPTALIQLHPGDVVLDLGSGGGIDVLLSAKRVGPTGKAYGLDMTDEMLTLARQNAVQAGAKNVEFLKGHMEDIPLPDQSVDVVISNCVINLSPDKGRVLCEAFRVLKPGGRFAVSDVVIDGPVPADLRRQIELWVGCLAGALEQNEYLGLLERAGFVERSITPTRYYAASEIQDDNLAAWLALQPLAEQERLNRAFFSAFVRARKPI